jgi:hypothetical protein
MSFHGCDTVFVRDHRNDALDLPTHQVLLAGSMAPDSHYQRRHTLRAREEIICDMRWLLAMAGVAFPASVFGPRAKRPVEVIDIREKGHAGPIWWTTPALSGKVFCMERMKSTGGHRVTHAASGTPMTLEERLTQAKRDARRFRRDWPRFSAKMSAFLAAIQVMPLVKRAAKAAGVHRSSHYRKLKSCPAYAETFQEAQMIGIDFIWDLAVERAVLGWEEPLVYRGRISLRRDPATGAMIPVMVRKFDNHLLMFLLDRFHPAFARVPHCEGSNRNLEERLNAGRRRAAEARQIKTPA